MKFRIVYHKVTILNCKVRIWTSDIGDYTKEDEGINLKSAQPALEGFNPHWVKPPQWVTSTNLARAFTRYGKIS